MEPQTDREIIIQVDGKLDSLTQNVERLATIVERLETTKFEELDERIKSLEKFQNQWGGVLIAFNIIIAIIAIYVGFKK